MIKNSIGGYLALDHRASPGLSEEAALRRGYDPVVAGEGGFLEADTWGCPHCGSVVIKNPFRTRARAHCFKCHQYICDNCEAARHDPDYKHYTLMELVEKCKTGKFFVVGESQSKLRLVPVTGDMNG